MFLLVLIVSCFQANAQVPVQQVHGSVVDRDSRKPLAGVSVVVSEGGDQYAVTDSAGNFYLYRVPVGRIRISFTSIGYQDYTTDNLLINAAKEPELLVEMEEIPRIGEGVVIRTIRNQKLPVNKFALVSGRSFSPEETQRYAASANDPGRMALGFPGVQATRDARSDIIIRGNNPIGMQWRLEGVDIVNPNHFARKGGTGGGITILSLSMLDNSDFLTGAMPAEYGDVLSGVFDMHFRKGNDQKHEGSFKAGMIGLDLSGEGPIKKGLSSYLLNYRYSTLGLLDKIGLNLVDERESNTFQDLSVNLSFRNKKNSMQWNLWGIGGYSREKYSAVDDTLDWKQYDDYAIYDFRTKMGAMGIGHTWNLSDRSFVRSALVTMGQQITYIDDTLNRKRMASTVNDELYNNSRISFTSSYNHKFSALANIKTGFYGSRIFYRFKRDRLDFQNSRYENIINGDGHTLLLQPYVQMSIKPGTKWVINPGLHVMHLVLNKKTTVDPRISVQYKFNGRQNISMAYGLHSKILPLGSYFYKQPSTEAFPNLNLDMIRAHHYILAYDQLVGRGWRTHAELYYQKLLKVPVVNDINRTFWILNEVSGYAQEALVSKGTGENRGLDLTLEKFFSKGLFMIINFSLTRSTFQPLNKQTYNTRFNSGSSGSWTGAREWGLKKNRVFQLGWKMAYNGGFRLTPLAGAAYVSTREPVLDETKPFTEQIDPYFRADARLAIRKDKTGRAWQLAIDIQNVLGLKNTDGLSRRYDPSLNQWVLKNQSGIVPVLSYQLDF
jgi:hypothetical protein